MTYMSNQAFLLPSSIATIPSSKIWDERLMRLTDVVIALAALIFLAPLMLIVAALVYITNPDPSFLRIHVSADMVSSSAASNSGRWRSMQRRV
jgi:lipopolysaccharide/colanic/teichoic acid biosynthesis glycosyltransferase